VRFFLLFIPADIVIGPWAVQLPRNCVRIQWNHYYKHDAVMKLKLQWIIGFGAEQQNSSVP
jgi:hypothetical protein